MDHSRPGTARPDPTLSCWRFYRRPIAVLIFALLLEMIAVFYITVHSGGYPTRGLDYLGLWIHIMAGVGMFIAIILFIRSTVQYRRLRYHGRWQPVPVSVPYIRPIHIGTTDSTTAICASSVYAPTTVPVSYSDSSANPSSGDTMYDTANESGVDSNRGHSHSNSTSTAPPSDSMEKLSKDEPPSYSSLFR